MPPKPRDLDAVIFDLFGTLVDNIRLPEYATVAQQMALAVGADPAHFAELWISETWPMRRRGDFPSLEANIVHICRRLKIEPAATAVRAAARLRSRWTRTLLEPVSGCVPALRSLRACGLRIGLITDCAPDVPYAWARSAFADYVDIAVFSCVERVAKPDRRIYERACGRLAVVPDRTLFVGDGSSDELSGARRARLHALLIRTDYSQAFDSVRHEVDNWSGPAIDELGDLALRLTPAHA